MRIDSRICNNCGAQMLWNDEKKMSICNLCGNAVEFGDDGKKEYGSYTN